MPQLDQISFLSQLTWLCIFYFGFHLILIDNFLPKISTILKLRKKKLLNSLSNSQGNFEESDFLKNYDSILAQSVQQSETSVQKGVSEKAQWINNFVKKLNSENWNKLNNSYLKRLATIKANQNIIYTNLFTPLSHMGTFGSIEFADKINNTNLNQKSFQSEQFHIQLYKILLSGELSKDNLKNKNFLKKGNKPKFK